MSQLQDVLASHVDDGSVPGAVGLVARDDRVEVCAVGSVDVAGTAPMARDTIFRIASITKPITAAAAMMLIEDGRIALDDPVAPWLPELASPTVVRTPAAPVDDVVPAIRPITVSDLLTFRAGYGFPSDFSLPAVGLLFSELKQGPPAPQLVASPDEWMAALSRIPLLHQPGDAWLYNTCSDILGVLIARVSGDSLPDFLAERLFEPLGMVDTGFAVPADELDRFTSYYRPDPAGGLELVDVAGRAVEQHAGVPFRRRRARLHRRRLALVRPDDARGRNGSRTAAVVSRVGPADDHRSPDPAPAPGAARCSWRARGGASAARSTSRPSTRGTCRDGTAGSAAPEPRRTSRPRRERSPSCSASGS